MARSLHAVASTLSLKPGVYLFMDARGSVLYVGKANSLRKRVLQYFDPARLDPAKQDLVQRARGIDTIVTATDAEALALEATLIQKHSPPYNVRLMDDSSYLYVKITNEPYPKVSLTRRVLLDGAWYRGPFPSARAIRGTIQEARKLFPWCAYPNPGAPHARPCFAYHVGLCPGICIRAISLEEYQQSIVRLKRFLDGDTKDALRALRARMDRLSETQAYERAARVRDAMASIERAMTPQNVVTPRQESADVIGIARHGAHGAAAVLQVRGGRVLGTQVFSLLHPADEATPTVLRAFLLQYYAVARGDVPAVIAVVEPEDAGSVRAWLTQTHGTSATLKRAQRGWKRTLVDLATANADEALKKSLTELTSPAQLQNALQDLAHALGLPHPPRRIEAYDVSNIQGTLATASLVVFVDGKPAPSAYRKFHITAAGRPNDVAMMQEVLRRRFGRHVPQGTEYRGQGTGKRERDRALSPVPSPLSPRSDWPLPDLVLLDGGKAQLNVGRQVLQEFHLDIPIAALAKREEELFLPGRRTPVLLPRTSAALYLVQRLRDEAHRFTLGYHQLLRKKRMTQSLLEEIPGVGAVTRKKLFRTFGSLRGIRDASAEALAHAVGSRKTAETIAAFLRAVGQQEPRKPR